MTDNERITELETRVAFQESTIQELNDVITRQQQQIELLQGAHQKLYARLEEVSQGMGDAPVNDVPPHY